MLPTPRQRSPRGCEAEFLDLIYADQELLRAEAAASGNALPLAAADR
jgi:hypothetical protein